MKYLLFNYYKKQINKWFEKYILGKTTLDKCCDKVYKYYMKAWLIKYKYELKHMVNVKDIVSEEDKKKWK